MYVSCCILLLLSWISQAEYVPGSGTDLVLQTLDAEQPPPSEKKVSSKVTKAQRRAQQAEFNRQLWSEAYVFFSIVSFGYSVFCDLRV